MYTESQLMHHGVKGMRWGKRKVSPRTSISERLKANRKPKAKDLTDDELRDHINRMRLERDYKELRKNSSAIGKGLNFTDDMGKKIVSGLVVGVTVSVGKKYASDKLGFKV